MDQPVRGRFITLEGGEGAGKSTQIRLLGDYLKAQGRRVVTTREPGGTPEGGELRKLLLRNGSFSWEPMAETLLMVADRAQHVRRTILPALEAGVNVISDRYVVSTLSYQGAAIGVPAPLIRDLHRQTCADLWPDLTIVLDVDPAVGLMRSRRRLSEANSDEDRFERLGPDFHARVRTAFVAYAAENPEASLLVDATLDVDAVHEAIRCRADALFDVSSR